MLSIVLDEQEFFDEGRQEFVHFEACRLELEHSLVSLSKWESKFQKPFLSKDPKTPEEWIGYLEAMILNPILPESIWERLSTDHLTQINDYIESPQSATTFSELPGQKGKGRSETITSELIYFWMVSFNIPFECEMWHLNRLFALVRICNVKNSKPKKMSKSEQAQKYRELNAQRRAKLGTSG